MIDRREFLKHSGASAAALAVMTSTPGQLFAAPAPDAPSLARFQDGAGKELLMVALTAAKSAGASYADARIGRYRQNFVVTREQQIINVVDTDTLGCGVRVLVDGCWGFAGTRLLTRDAVAGAAREATAIAKANRIARDRPIELAPAPAVPNGVWKGAFTTDPLEVPLEQKVDLLLKANAEALKVKGVRFVNSVLFFVKQERLFASTDGTLTDQTFVRSWPMFTATAVAPDFSDFQSRQGVEAAPMGRGWEYVLECDLVGNAGKWGEEAVQKLTARSVEVGKYDLL
ncbi:MAG: twin-arginine translocation signal domain-containing protein, partial [Gemmatimonadetes bacterium]|nr:twin-arginine translocation signal domain-containing protein [Gemmatimonadota bacterium]